MEQQGVAAALAVQEQQPHEPCAICLSDIHPGAESTVVLECDHAFHGNCIATAFRYSPRCPMCRGDPFAELEAKWREQSHTYNQVKRKKQEIINSPELSAVQDIKEQALHQHRSMKRKIQTEMRVHGEVIRRMKRLQQKKEYASSKLQWCQSRVRAELLKHNVPLNIHRPRRPVRPGV